MPYRKAVPLRIMMKIIFKSSLLFIILFTFSLFAETKIEVSGIIGGDNPVAIVNGSVMKIGDEINGTKIIEIKGDYVKFQYKGESSFFIRRIGEGISQKLTPKKSLVPQINTPPKRLFVRS